MLPLYLFTIYHSSINYHNHTSMVQRLLVIFQKCNHNFWTKFNGHPFLISNKNVVQICSAINSKATELGLDLFWIHHDQGPWSHCIQQWQGWIRNWTEQMIKAKFDQGMMGTLDSIPHHDVKINKNQNFDQGQFEQ